MTKIVKHEKAHASLQSGLAKMIERLEAFDIEAGNAEFVISDIASRCQRARDLAKEKRDAELAPYVPEVQEIRKRWKPIVDGFDDIFKRAKALASDVLRRKRAAQERERKAAQDKLLAAQRAAAKKKTEAALARQRETIEKLKDKVESMPPEGAPLGVKTDETTLYSRKVWKWETQDVTKVPDKFCKRYVDGAKVDLAVKNGMREIPGIKIFQEEEMVSRRKP
jgi:hypothetical protein